MLERASTVPKLTTLEGGGEQSDQLFSELQAFEPPDVRPCSLRRLINYHSDRERGFLAWVPCAERICMVNEQLPSYQGATAALRGPGIRPPCRISPLSRQGRFPLT